MTHEPWSAGNDGAGKRRWFVSRMRGDGRGAETLNDRRGNIRRFASWENAKRAADQANKSDAET